jgi:hypothetical protein
MNKKIIFGLLIIIIIFLGAFFVISLQNKNVPNIDTEKQIFDGKNSTFTINGQAITLTNGLSEISVPDSSSKITTRYFGNEARGNLTNNGSDDYAFIVTQDTGGSGIFYYVIVAYRTSEGYKTTNAFLIGDRIAPQSTHIQEDARELYINYAERKPGEPMTARPSQGATLTLKVTPNGILEGLMK